MIRIRRKCLHRGTNSTVRDRREKPHFSQGTREMGHSYPFLQSRDTLAAYFLLQGDEHLDDAVAFSQRLQRFSKHGPYHLASVRPLHGIACFGSGY